MSMGYSFSRFLRDAFRPSTNPQLFVVLEGRLFWFTPGKIQVQDDDGNYREPTQYERNMGNAFLLRLMYR